jgi:hypothetical protein
VSHKRVCDDPGKNIDNNNRAIAASDCTVLAVAADTRSKSVLIIGEQQRRNEINLLFEFFDDGTE